MKTPFCITLPVTSLSAALEFYRDGLGLPADDVGELTADADHFALKLEGGWYLVLISRAGFSEFTMPVQHTVADSGTSECILTIFATSQNEVDEVLQRTAAHGGTIVSPAAALPWGYAGIAKDPDGHLWEIMFNPRMNG